MEQCPYCNEFMEISKDNINCPHLSIDPANEWCCPNCDAHFDLSLNEVPTNISMSNKEYEFTPAPEPTPPSDLKSDSTQNPSQESSKGDSSAESKNDFSTGQTPSYNFPPAQIALAKQVLKSLQDYQDFSKIKTSVIHIVKSLQDYLAQKSIA